MLSVCLFVLVDRVPRAKLTQFCSQETSERMAIAAWEQAQDILRHESEEDEPHHAHALPATLSRFRASVGVACTAALATNYNKKGPHQCFVSICKAGFDAADRDGEGAPLLRQQCTTYHLNLNKTIKRTRSGKLVKRRSGVHIGLHGRSRAHTLCMVCMYRGRPHCEPLARVSAR